MPSGVIFIHHFRDIDGRLLGDVRITPPKEANEPFKVFAHVDRSDAAMNAAIGNAKKTSGQFLRAFRNPKPSYHDFCVKKPYPAKPSRYEHIWITDIREVGDHFEGRVDSNPYETHTVKYGQRVSVKLAEISDWKYLDGNRLVGGYTVRYFYDRMNTREKKSFLNQMGYVIE
jgi:uncharacterized protein YegJ (DUF2314 family)